MNAEILTVGTELLLGDILNSNSQFLSREMAAYGIDILYQSTVGDNRERLKSALELALGRCDMVIVTGGLGPTEDDLTRETVAEYFNLPLELHEESERRIREYFQNTGREYAENNKKQAMLPQGCVVFPNDHGTAPGCAVEKYGQRVILLPGPPRELMPMFTQYVVPYLSERCDSTIHSHTVGVFGIIAIAVTFLPVVLELTLMMAALWGSAAIGDIFGREKEVSILKAASSALTIMLGVILCYGMMIIVSITIMLMLGTG